MSQEFSNYQKDEIQICQDEPPDIIFRDARFEVTECQDDNRKRGDEYKEKLQRAKCAKGIKDFLEPYESRSPITEQKLLEKISKGISNKGKYDLCTRQSLDALVYVNLKEFAGYDGKTKVNNIPAEWVSQSWRSVSFVMDGHAGVLFCNSNAPQFLKDLSKKGIVLAKDPLSIWQ
ncbi:DUF1780 domain-containing protein [Candidatus Woesearchaeota archaeon]|nr:DUF1780 domain-containing protein [Candidatus Woesearchaeota archaeon]